MTDVPKDAREQIEALLHNQPVGYERQGNAHPPPWLCRLALRALDMEAAASEAVTEEMIRQAIDAYEAAPGVMQYAAMKAALRQAAPGLLLAGRRRGEAAGEQRGLERAAADYERRADELCAEADADDAADRPEFATSARERASVLRVLALELRALGRPA